MSMPVAVVAGIISPSGVTLTPSVPKPKDLGMDGPVISASRMAVCFPLAFIFTARREVTRDLPTPPFPLTMPITFPTELAGFKGSKKLVRSVVRLLQFSLQELQSWVQFSLTSLIFNSS